MFNKLAGLGLLLGVFLVGVISPPASALESNAEKSYNSSLSELQNSESECTNAGGTWDNSKGECKKGGKVIQKSLTVPETIQAIINMLLFISGAIAVLVIVVAGFRFVMSNGDSGTVGKAKEAIIYAVIGLVVVVMAYAIVNFVLKNI